MQGNSRLEHIWWLSLGSGGLLGTEPTPVLAQNQEAPSTAVTGKNTFPQQEFPLEQAGLKVMGQIRVKKKNSGKICMSHGSF